MKKRLTALLAVLFIVLSVSGCSIKIGDFEILNFNKESEVLVERYKETAKKYIESGNFEEAVKMIEEGIELTDDESLKDYLEVVKELMEAADNQPATAVPVEDIEVTDVVEVVEDNSNEQQKTDNNTYVHHDDSADKKVQISRFNSMAADIEFFEEQFYNSSLPQQQMNIEADKLFKKWDKLLNEVYQYLKTILPANEFKSLEADELVWIKQKEAAAKSASDEFSGGSMAPCMYSSTAASYTKDRCYYLISLIK